MHTDLLPQPQEPIFIEKLDDSMTRAALSPDECDQVRKARRRRIWGFVGWFFLFLFVGFFLWGMVAALVGMAVMKFIPEEYLITISQFAIVIVLGLVLWATVNRLLARLRPFNRDLAEGQKEIKRMRISDKFASNVQVTSSGWRVTSRRGQYYYVVINDRNYGIDYEIYQKISKTQPVAIHFAPRSKVVLKIEF
ncbi:hypothetical protein SAMN05421780_10390 [Flexibacter flexilis DSM 6793]|uniref:Uncharacterized protein n=1 Tax=Flexibacter flexilis DSM 6793 TaxID=927664 RepID=A0A1I1GTT5_9BACT|nr:hypothetical protein SAMN05421780_10390 [Flexibacter flexilis DSM 6793]